MLQLQFVLTACFKVFTYPKINAINEILNRISYLIFVPVATVLCRDGTETKVLEPENRENCLKTVDYFLMIPVTVILFLFLSIIIFVLNANVVY